MYDIHWRAMDRLAQDNNLHKVHLRYNSNLVEYVMATTTCTIGYPK